MTLFTGIMLYILIWWTALFAVLPLGVRPHGDEGFGTAGSAPEHPEIKKKFIITTLVSALVWLGIYGLIRADVVDFRGLARQMDAADRAGDGQARANVLETGKEKAEPPGKESP